MSNPNPKNCDCLIISGRRSGKWCGKKKTREKHSWRKGKIFNLNNSYCSQHQPGTRSTKGQWLCAYQLSDQQLKDFNSQQKGVPQTSIKDSQAAGVVVAKKVIGENYPQVSEKILLDIQKQDVPPEIKKRRLEIEKLKQQIPFYTNQAQKLEKELKTLTTNIKNMTSHLNRSIQREQAFQLLDLGQPITPPSFGRTIGRLFGRKVRFGARGGRYIIKKGRKKYF